MESGACDCVVDGRVQPNSVTADGPDNYFGEMALQAD
eukprot:COSAG04_NODE_23641_length_335_cov_0.644068_1_plen_36_part_10